MVDNRQPTPGWTAVVLAAIVLVMAALRSAAGLLVPVIVAGLVAVVVAPYQQRLVRRGMSGIAAFALVALATVAGLVVVVAITEAAISTFIADLPSYAPGMEQLLRETLQFGARVHLDLTRFVNAGSTIRGVFSSTAGLTSSLLTALAASTLVVLLAVFMLLEALDFPEKLAPVMGADGMRRAAVLVDDLSGFLRLTTVDAGVTAIADLVILLLLGAPSALLWAGLAFLFSYIPNVGYLMIVVPPTAATFVVYGAGRALLVLVSLTVVDFSVGTFLLPRLIGSRLGISPFWTVLALVFWAWFLGPAGAVLAIPLTLGAKFLLESSPATAPIASLIAPLSRKP